MTEPERKLKAKIPCPETGIEIKRSVCAICEPGGHCGLKAYVKDGKIIKIEGDEDHPANKGKLCAKGASNRRYVYHKDRVLYPMRRVGKKGEGKFERITWDEAMSEIAEKLSGYKKDFGAESVVFLSGYSKWYRAFLRRFAFSFGSPNYGTESSVCFTSGFIAWKLTSGVSSGADMGNADLFFGWGFNPHYSASNMIAGLNARKAKGMKIIIADPRITPATEQYADLHMRIRPGTDGALAHAIANELIENDWIDKEYIEKYVHGFEEYKEYVKGFNGSNVEELTGVPYEQVKQAAKMIHEAGSFSTNESSAPLGHHINGMQNYRAIKALQLITGNYDVKGGNLPKPHTFTHVSSDFTTLEEEFQTGTWKPDFAPAVGSGRFPLWYHTEREMQTCDLPRQILEGTPYPIKAVFASGFNARMLPGTDNVLKALKELEYFVDIDLFMTEAASYADIVLPACTSLEREEFKNYGGGFGYFTKPAIAPLGESRNDVEIYAELANRLDLDDDLLRGGYRKCMEWIFKDNKTSLQDFIDAGKPIRPEDWKPFEYGKLLENGAKTPTGKLELKSEVIASHPEWGLDALPTYTAPKLPYKDEEYPFVFVSGGRIPNGLHSRLQRIGWARAVKPVSVAEMNDEDAKKLGIEEGDKVTVSTFKGSITLTALPTETVIPGYVFVYHSYKDADANSLNDENALDPYTGFPAYNSGVYCKVCKEEK